MGIKDLFFNGEWFIITIKNGKEESKLVAKKDERIQIKDGRGGVRYVTAGADTPENLKQYVTMEPVTSQNKYKVKMIKKEMKNKNRK